MYSLRVPAPVDIQVLHEQLDAISREAKSLADGLSSDLGVWREVPDSWSVAECFDHLATGNRIYLGAMQEGAFRARKQGRLRQEGHLYSSGPRRKCHLRNQRTTRQRL